MNQQNLSQPVFLEIQRLRSPLVWVLLSIAVIAIWVTLISQLLPNNFLGDDVMPTPLLIVFWLLFGIGLPAIFLFGNLRTAVRGDGIYVRFWPFHFSDRKMPFTEIARCEVREYKPVREYGGWGIKCGKGGWSYTMSGNRGVQLEFTDGKRLLIGSQRADELGHAILSRLPTQR